MSIPRKTLTRQQEIEQIATGLEESEREYFADHLQLARAVYAHRYCEEKKRKAKVKEMPGFQPNISLTTEGLSLQSDTNTVTQPRTGKAKVVPFPVNPVRPATW